MLPALLLPAAAAAAPSGGSAIATGLGLGALGSLGLLADPMRRWSNERRIAAGEDLTPEQAAGAPAPTAKSTLPYGQDLAPEEWLSKFGDNEQLLEALRAMVKSGSAGGGGVDLSEYRKAIADDEAKRADFMANLNAKRGALQAAIAARGIPEVFDGRRVDEELRKATPDVRPDNTGFWMGQNAKGWYSPGKGIVASQNTDGAARLMAEISNKAGDDYEKRIAQQLGLGREAILGRNTQRAAEDRNVEDALSVTMPGKVDLDLLNQGAKAQGALSMAGLKAQASANNAMAKLASKQSPEAMLLRAHELKAMGEKTKNPMLVELGNSLLKNLHGDVKEPEFKKDKFEAALAVLSNSKMPGNINVPTDIANQVAMGIGAGKLDPMKALEYAIEKYKAQTGQK